MAASFFEQPVLNSPYEAALSSCAGRKRAASRCFASRRKAAVGDHYARSDAANAVGTHSPRLPGFWRPRRPLDGRAVINEIRSHVESWRALPNPSDWGVTPTTARLLTYWRSHEFSGFQPFFCQIEAVETIIWLTEVASRRSQYRSIRAHLEGGNAASNPELFRTRDEDGDRGRQDDRHGYADRLAHGERRALVGQQPVQQGFSHRHARHHHPRPAARAEARGPGKLLRVFANSSPSTSSPTSPRRRSSSPNIAGFRLQARSGTTTPPRRNSSHLQAHQAIMRTRSSQKSARA